MKYSTFEAKLRFGIKRILVDNVESKIIDSSDHKNNRKVIITGYDDNHNKFLISQAWLIDKHGNINIHGLWLYPEQYNKNVMISPQSAVARLLSHYNCSKPRDLKDNIVFAYPNDRKFLAIIAYDWNSKLS